ncbi:hypothetical protein [Flavihumibacter sp. ZG627]|uniref:hypothetical protein n=1 Tax=Flavihumibacter sp. ZG627 TaxID=1463156 RepID=UPI00057F9F5D|nr:hypothetical protein [Flavihumibacter sp. ZG627]KIC92261.1 hypothetical protein HY58_01525 [Flavihumibacter sp. ZG627]
MKYVVTIATGNAYYIKIAENLAISFIYWNKNKDINFVILTDNPHLVDKKIESRIQVIDISKHNSNGFLSKFELINHLKDGEVLFLDADCIIYGDLTNLFNKLKGKGFAAFGKQHITGEGIGYCRSIPRLLENVGISYFPIITGSLYYYDDFELASRIINHAREYANSYDQLGLIRLRKTFNEEPLIGIGMARENIIPLENDAFSKGDLMFFENVRSNVLSGKARLWNNLQPPVPYVTDLLISTPLIVHFDGINTQFYKYRSEVFKLRLWFIKGIHAGISGSMVNMFYKAPHQIVEYLKNSLRPFWHKVFGVNRIKESLR